MGIKYILNRLAQLDLYKYAMDTYFPHVNNGEKKNERDIFRLFEDKVKQDNLVDKFVEVLQFISLYKEYKGTKSHHKATRNRHENALEMASWMMDNWHEDEEDRNKMIILLTMATPDIRIKAAMIAMSHYDEFTKFRNNDLIDLSEEESTENIGE